MVVMAFTSVLTQEKKKLNFYTQQMWDGGKHSAFLNLEDAEGSPQFGWNNIDKCFKLTQVVSLLMQ